MRITFVTRKFGNVERYSHCDVLHITPIRVANLVLDCNGDFAINAYWVETTKEKHVFRRRGGVNRLGDNSAFVISAGQLLLTRRGKTIMYTVGIVFEFYTVPL